MAAWRWRWTVCGEPSVSDSGTTPRPVPSVAPWVSTRASPTTKTRTYARTTTCRYTNPTCTVKGRRTLCWTVHTRGGSGTSPRPASYMTWTPPYTATTQVRLLFSLHYHFFEYCNVQIKLVHINLINSSNIF